MGEGPEADSRPVVTAGRPAVGEILADRYRLEEHINDDAAGRQVWRGADVVLRRPVAVVLRYPGGESAEEMLSAAVAASRVTHSNLVGVYDAIDEGQRAYVVREWVDGAALRDYAAQAPLDAARATTIGHAVASAVAAVHATGMVHGNIHPGTVLIGTEGRVVLADARADDAVTSESDIRAIGGVLYFALTGRWPQAEVTGATRQRLPDAVRDTDGALAAPRQVRAGVPAYLDELTMDLLDGRLALPSAEVLSAELGRLDAEAEVDATMDTAYYDTDSPLGFGSVGAADGPRPAGRKVAIGVVALLLVAVVGLLIGTRLLSGSAGAGPNPGPGGTTPPASTGSIDPGTSTLRLVASQVRVIDPEGTRSELDGVEKAIDGDPGTAWETERYKNRPDFGGIKKGMGILINLGEARKVSVEVSFTAAGGTAEMRSGTSDAPATKAGDTQLVAAYPAGQPREGIKMVFDVDPPAQYLLLWITSLPKVEDGPTQWFKIGVQEIVVHLRK